MNDYDDPIVAKLQKAVSFPVDVECEGFPDIIFNIILEKRPDEIAIEKCVTALEEYVNSYNRKHFFSPIHYVSDRDTLPEPSSVFSVCVHMDFGNANLKGLVGAVKAIANTGLPIYRVVLE